MTESFSYLCITIILINNFSLPEMWVKMADVAKNYATNGAQK